MGTTVRGSCFLSTRSGRSMELRCRLESVDVRSASRLLSAAEALDYAGVRSVRLDLSGVTRADTCLVAVLVLIEGFLAAAGIALELAPLPRAARAILSVYRRKGSAPR